MSNICLYCRQGCADAASGAVGISSRRMNFRRDPVLFHRHGVIRVIKNARAPLGIASADD